MFKHLLLPWLMPLFGMFFAAGADALAGAGGGAEGAVIESGGAEGGDSNLVYGTDDQQGVDDQQRTDDQAQRADSQQQIQEEPEIQEFKGSVSARVRNLTKQAPELTQI